MPIQTEYDLNVAPRDDSPPKSENFSDDGDTTCGSKLDVYNRMSQLDHSSGQIEMGRSHFYPHLRQSVLATAMSSRISCLDQQKPVFQSVVE